MKPLRSSIVETARAAVDLLLPPCCAGCGTPIAFGVLCAPCAVLVERLPRPRCPRCATPFEAPGRDHECGACLRKPPPFLSASAPFVYAGPVADGLRALKYGPRADRAAGLAELWRQEAGELPEADLALPVPVHASRLRERGFNQVVLLARPLVRRLGLRLDTDSLLRSRLGPAQAGLTGRRRLEAPRGAFVVPPRRGRRLEGRRVLLLDDVVTTGATAAACARALRRAGVSEVHLAVLARA